MTSCFRAVIVSVLLGIVTAAPAFAERCSVYDSVSATIEKAQTKSQIIAALIMIEPLSGEEIDAIIGSFPEADDFRPFALSEVASRKHGCAKD